MLLSALEDKNQSLIPIVGPAGSGKSTLLKQCAYEIATRRKVDCYFIDDSAKDIVSTLRSLERIHPSRMLVCVDRLDPFAEDIAQFLEKHSMKGALIVGCDRETVWKRRTQDYLSSFARQVFPVDTLHSNDAPAILDKVKKYGPWTRLSKMDPEKRKLELLDKAKNQLLIGLMEATSGEGYPRIIRSEYNALSSKEAQILLQLIGLAAASGKPVRLSHLARACRYMGLNEDLPHQIEKLRGIVKRDNDVIYGRHPVYFSELFENVVPTDQTAEAINAFLHAYTAFGSPVLKAINRADGRLFKSVINHRFLRRMLKDKSDLVLGVYKNLEKAFELDGLFLLQYGLALRSVDEHTEALAKLRTAVEAYPQSHTEHAYALQQMIVASLTDSRTEAESLMLSAKDALLRLDHSLESHDTYPIVTLAEWHTRIVRKLDGEDAGRKVASQYAKSLGSRRAQAARVEKTYNVMFKYASTGIWQESALDYEEYGP